MKNLSQTVLRWITVLCILAAGGIALHLLGLKNILIHGECRNSIFWMVAFFLAILGAAISTIIFYRRRCLMDRKFEDQVNALILQTLPLRVSIIDRDGNYRYARFNGLQYGHRRDASPVGCNVLEWFSDKNDADAVMDHTQTVLATDEMIIRNYGNRVDRFFISYGKRISSDFFGVPAALFVTVDISELHNAQEQLKKESSFFRATLDSIADPVFVADDQLNIILCNRAALEQMELSDEEAKALNFMSPQNLFFNRSGEMVGAPLRSAVQRQEPVIRSSDVYLKRRSDGRMIPFSQHAAPVCSEDRRIIGAVMVCHDLSTIMELNERLSQDVKRTHMLIDNIGAAVVLFNADLSVAHANAAACSLFELAADRIVAHQCNGMSCLFESVSGGCPVRRVRDTGVACQAEFRHRESGRTSLIFVRPLMDSSGAVAKIVLTSVDISSLVETRARLSSALEKANAAMLAKSSFLATMSHELRTPLNAIIGFSELLDSSELSETQREYTQSIHVAGSALLRIINDVLDISKLDSDKEADIPLYPVDVAEILRELYSMFLAITLKKSLTLKLEMPETLPLLISNGTRLRQILFNLIGNAVKFTEQGEVVIRISWVQHEGAEPRGDFSLEVRDTGIGIAPENQGRIFEQFQQIGAVTPGARCYEGTGLGLSIVKRLVERLNGALTLESELGHGSCFAVTFRNIAWQKNAPKPEPDTPQVVACEHSLTGEQVWVVDDVEMNRRVMAFMIKKLGLECRNFESGAQLLEVLAETEVFPQVILTDLWMPEMTGEDLALRLKESERFRAIPLVAITADSENSRHFDMTLFDATLHKPVGMKNISDVLQTLHVKFFRNDGAAS